MPGLQHPTSLSKYIGRGLTIWMHLSHDTLYILLATKSAQGRRLLSIGIAYNKTDRGHGNTADAVAS